MKTTILSLVVGLGIFFIVTAPAYSHIKCPIKFLGTTNDKCPHFHQAPEATSTVWPDTGAETANAKRLRLEKEKQARIKKQKEREWKAAQVQQEHEARARRMQEDRDRMHREQRAQEQRLQRERINSDRRTQEQGALRNIDRERNYISQPIKNEEVMRAEDNLARALRNVRGQQ